MADISEQAFASANRQGEEERARLPLPRTARFDAPSGRIVVEFVNGSVFSVPARALQDLQDATDAELAEVELAGETGLHWEKLDVDFSIAGLVQGIFGTAAFMKVQARNQAA